MIVLGIDPGTRRIGYGVLEVVGTKTAYRTAGILPIASTTDDAALVETRRGMEDLIARWKPDILAIEKLFFAKNRKTAIAVAQARGVILETCAARDLRIKELSPNEVKLQLTGYGGADKRAVSKMVRLILNDAPDLIDDAMDALGLALVGARMDRFGGNISK